MWRISDRLAQVHQLALLPQAIEELAEVLLHWALSARINGRWYHI